ncbi:uncharacterized protein [Zea mays]|uniref:Uncharacterized protein n=2 Tax=Zea mays TaxID=4577 RepID=A0A1D6GPD5_MAIZE|nr:uncharacterized protein LOC100276355 [Zea mays]AQK65034.1 hypothetical protein ZEAMMB73_Zm00001d014005 [Zea mays]|eukprot:XP_008644765.1 uncharacterized protein LOC100276355 [Zea mays]
MAHERHSRSLRSTNHVTETVDEEDKGQGKESQPPQSRVPPAATTTTAMISILAQERLLGFALGSVSMGGFVLHQRRAIYRSIAEADGSSYFYQPGEIAGRRSSTELAHVWNKAVDETLGKLVVYLSSRGW